MTAAEPSSMGDPAPDPSVAPAAPGATGDPGGEPLPPDPIERKRRLDRERKKRKRAEGKGVAADSIKVRNEDGTTQRVPRAALVDATAATLAGLTAAVSRRTHPDVALADAEARDIADAGVRMAEVYGWFLKGFPAWTMLAVAAAPWTFRCLAAAVAGYKARKAAADAPTPVVVAGDDPVPDASPKPAPPPAEPDAVVRTPDMPDGYGIG